jgi:acyl-CoA thioester hydrolase
MQIDFKKSCSLRVRYGETDQMGYCYYGNYAQYFEVGRVEALREIGLSYKTMEANGIMLPVNHFEVKYHKPALYDDNLRIDTYITELKGARLIFKYEIYNEENILLSEASTTLVFVNKETMKPVIAPANFLKLIAPYEK